VSRERGWLLLAVALIFAAGLAIRLTDLTDPPLDFHPVRQLHSAIIARGMLAESGRGVFSDWERQRAVEQGQAEAIIEPPILERLVGWTYIQTGAERLWVARLYSLLFWTAGGIAVWALGRRLGGTAGALVALLFYLFLPYGVFASRSFQPDPLMAALMAFSLWAFWRWLERPVLRRAILAGGLFGAAVLVKQVAVFPLLGGAAGLVLAGMGLKAAVRKPQAWLIAALAVLPVAAYNVYGLLVSGALGGQYSLRFFPSLWVDPAFYIRWARQVDQTVGMLPFLAVLVGAAWAGTRHGRGLLAGLLAGYGLYGFLFAYHISTHDYYQVPLIPVVALGLAPVAEGLAGALRREGRRLVTGVAAVALLAGCLYSLYDTRAQLRRVDYRSEPEVWYQLAESLGFDGGSVIGLYDDYGVRLQYYGYITPQTWPTTGDVAMRAEAGVHGFAADFREATAGKQFFVVTDFADLAKQPELAGQLEQFPVLLEGDDYRVYDLRGADGGSNEGQ
jgi:hypothetical protein